MASRNDRIDEIYDRAMAGKKDRLITSTMIKQFVQSPFTLWCASHAPASERDPMDAYRKYLFETGQKHEEATIKARFPGIKPVKAATPQEGFRLVLESMAEGVGAFHGAPLFWIPEGIKTEADILERAKGGKSAFGGYHYVVKEVKSAKNIRKEHVMQAAFNNFILGKVQAHFPHVE